MTRGRALATATVTAAVATAGTAGLAGCGGSSDPLDETLSYIPGNSAIVLAAKTNTSDEQYKRLGRLVDKFPFAGRIKEGIKNGVSVGGQKVAFDEFKPLLGNDLVVGFPVSAGRVDSGAAVFAWKVKDGGKAKDILSRNARQVGTLDGAKLYQETGGGFNALKGDILVASKSRAQVAAGLHQHGAPGKLTKDDFEQRLQGLDDGALVRLTGDFQKLLGARAAKARKIPWVAALKTFGASVSIEDDGIAEDFKVATSASPNPTELPLAAGAAAPSVVKRPGEFALALRDPIQVAKFVEQATAATNPRALAKTRRDTKKEGVDLDRDLIGQLGPSSALSVATDGKFAARVDLKDPKAFRATFAKAVKGDRDVRPGPKGLYTMDTHDGNRVVIGVVRTKLLIASDAQRAQEFALQPATPVPGTKGALAISADPRALINRALTQRARGAAAILGPALTAPLKDFTGYVESEARGLSGHLKLTIR